MITYFVFLSIASLTIKRGSIGLVKSLLLPQNILAIFSHDKIFMVLFLGYRMSGLKAGCPGITPDVRASCQISGPSHSRMHFCAVLLPDARPSTPDLRAPSSCRMSGLLAGYPGIAVQRMFLCWAARQMSGHMPDVRAFLLCRMSGLDPQMSDPSVSCFVFCLAL